MNPRNLSVLRIDDSIKTTKADAPPPYIAVHSFEIDDRVTVTAIKGWSSALLVWSSASSLVEPDLVVADVLFADDASTPLAKAPGFKDYSRFIPTGLSHLKPFAAIARSSGRPMGLAIQTSNPSIWKEAWVEYHPMAALAAHEIGELAALFGDRLAGESLEARVQECWRWLGNRSEATFYPALEVAIMDYRQRLIDAVCPAGQDERQPRAFVLPREWAELAAWCNACAAGEREGFVEEDRALPLLYADGRKDCIRFRSLFGEVEHLATDSLPAHCFAMTDEDPRAARARQPWVVDDGDGHPRIGAFVQALGSLQTVYREAVELIAKFPVRQPARLSGSLVDEGKRLPFAELTAGFAVLLQVVRWAHAHYRCWQEGLSQEGWSHRDLRLWQGEGTRPDYQDSLGGFLERLAGYLGAFQDEECFWIGDLTEEISGEPVLEGLATDTEWSKWHFRLLVDAGLLAFSSDGGYRALRQWDFRQADVPAPIRLPKGFSEEAGDLRKQLRDTLGFSKKYNERRSADDDNAIGVLLARAFRGQSDPQAGREFLDQLLDGTGAAWILELLRQYARETLEWREEHTWPRWLRSQN